MKKKNGLVKIDPEILRELSGGRGDVMDTYFHKYPVVTGLYWARLSKILRIAQRFSPKKVLDLGCGQGVFLPTLSQCFEEVHGIDLDVSISSKIKERFELRNVTLHEGNILQNDLEREQFDMIIAPSVLEHFKDQDALFPELKRLLKPGGRLVFSSPTETKLYEFGRKLFGAVKPEDHYHSVFAIQKFARNQLSFVMKENGPLALLPSLLSVYIICVFVKTG